MRKLCLILIVALLGSCTENKRAKYYGGNAKISLPKGKKLVNITWKDEQLWYLTRTMLSTEQPDTLYFQVESSLGLVEGTVILYESK